MNFTYHRKAKRLEAFEFLQSLLLNESELSYLSLKSATIIQYTIKGRFMSR